MQDEERHPDQPQGHDSSPPFPIGSHLPLQIGRYRVEKILGKGSFGIVYLAYDDELRRLVAIKVPHVHLVANPVQAEAYLTEARTVASLDHPNIVPVHDVGHTEQFPCFVVSKFIDGTDLSTRLRTSRLTLRQSVDLVAIVADALSHAHQRGLIHRDIKPGNLLLDRNGKPFVVDFGLALREQDLGTGPRYAGTPAYMSPEQARGEGHRVDVRPDIFSLGSVLYELMVGRRPFNAETQKGLLEQVANVEPRPPRQHDETIPRELERICLKALSKRAWERYPTASDMGDDLRHFLARQADADLEHVVSSVLASELQTTRRKEGSERSRKATSSDLASEIVPKGLRPFNEHDSDFFLDLLPGPRDREGLPESIRFWKSRIEETDADKTFRVGLIYGPSGCGKSSLVRAGLIPRLSEHVIVVYVESTADETETRLLKGLHKRCDLSSENLGLKETLAELRRGQGIPQGRKVVIVLDQFEQWLHARKLEQETELVQALRQCDGGRVQCLIMVRDDFWLAVSRFLRELEIRLVEGENCALVDLFDKDHAHKVLAGFGSAFGKLPRSRADASKEQEEFLKIAVSGLAQEEKIVCVQLALFAEMMKSKDWTPASLKLVGGTAGVGANFLNETFSAASAPPQHRYHQQAARAVLATLLPQSASNIKGHMRSYSELLEVSGYGNRPKEFDDLLRIIDGEVRLITPTDPDGKTGTDDSSSRSEPGEKYYQLTHDFLVPSLRDWLTRKQKETRRGRAELLLADRAAEWGVRRETRQLPTFWQWLKIVWWSEKKNWTAPQRAMMAVAGRHHLKRGMVSGLLLSVASISVMAVIRKIDDQQNLTKAEGLVQSVMHANTSQVPAILDKLAPFKKWAVPLLGQSLNAGPKNPRQELNLRLALLQHSPSQMEAVLDRLLDASPQDVDAIRAALAPYGPILSERLWQLAEAPEKRNESQRLRAAAALAQFDPDSQRWNNIRSAVVQDLVAVPSVHLSLWLELFRSVIEKLEPAWLEVCRSSQFREGNRLIATAVLVEYGGNKPELLSELLMEASEEQFAVVYPKVVKQLEACEPLLTSEMDRTLTPDASDEAKETLAKRQANAAVALLKMSRSDKVWPLLKHRPDPRVRSYLIDRVGSLSVSADILIDRLRIETDVTIRRALLLAFGEIRRDVLPEESRDALIQKLRESFFQTDDDPGIHASIEWLLSHEKRDLAWLKQENHRLSSSEDERCDQIRKRLEHDKEHPLPQWYVNSHQQTMIVIPAPVTFDMGSPTLEAGRQGSENSQIRQIRRSYAISSRHVTVEHYREFHVAYSHPCQLTNNDLPVVGISWHEAAAYCNWLSKQEGLPEDQYCYESGNGENQLRQKVNYLSLKGYRLPTEPELEYATRAGATTARCFGETDELLKKYAWFEDNSNNRTHHTGLLKPNDFGLFDVHGNVFTWCNEIPRDHVIVEDDNVEAYGQESGKAACRGGSFRNPSPLLRSDYSYRLDISEKDSYLGFRLAKTF